MFNRTFLLLLVVGAAVGIPYLSSEWPKLKAKVLGAAGAESSTSASVGATTSTSGRPTILPAPDPQAEETPLVEMNDAFSFGVTPSWIMSRWPRVTTGLAEDKLTGLRVPLITGLRFDDLAGAVTYYFTPSQNCAKITFTGSTGDPRRLTTLVSDRYGLKAFNSGEAGVLSYQNRWNGKVRSELTVRPAAVIRQASPSSRYDLQLTITNPGAK